MSGAPTKDADAASLMSIGRDMIEREAVYLDERKFDEWLSLFALDCEYWAPTWSSDDTLTTDPQRELSHIYYGDRSGLEDRVVRIRARSSPASHPAPRSTHILSSIRFLEAPGVGTMRLRSSWATHVFFTRSKESHTYFGHSEYALALVAQTWLIKKKKIVLQNDFIPTMLDVYCL